jgi:hypothetical protein
MSDLIVNQLEQKIKKVNDDPNLAVNTDSSLVLTDDELNFLLNNDKQIYNNIIKILTIIKGFKYINITYLLNVILLKLYKKNNTVNNLEVYKYLDKIQTIINDLVTRYKGKYGSFSQNFTRDADKLETRIHQLFIELLYSMNERSLYNFNNITTEKVIKDTAFNGGRKTRKNTKRRMNKKRSTYKRRMNKKRSSHRRRK